MLNVWSKYFNCWMCWIKYFDCWIVCIRSTFFGIVDLSTFFFGLLIWVLFFWDFDQEYFFLGFWFEYFGCCLNLNLSTYFWVLAICLFGYFFDYDLFVRSTYFDDGFGFCWKEYLLWLSDWCWLFDQSKYLLLDCLFDQSKVLTCNLMMIPKSTSFWWGSIKKYFILMIHSHAFKYSNWWWSIKKVLHFDDVFW